MDEHTLHLLLQHQARRCLASMAPGNMAGICHEQHKVTARFAAQLVYENYQNHIDRIKWDSAMPSGISDAYVTRVIKGIARDGDLIQRLMTRDEQAWIDVNITIINRLRCKANDLLTRDPDRLDDLVQIVQKTLFKALKTYPYDTEFDAWLSIVIRNTVGTDRKSAATHWDERTTSIDQPFMTEGQRELTLLDVLSDPRGERQRIIRELLAFVEESKSLLTQAEYQALQLTIDGFDAAEAAVLLNREVGTIYQMRSHLHKVLRKAWLDGTDEGIII